MQNNFEIKHYQDWKDSEGLIVMENPKTVDLYHHLKYNFQPKMRECFFAFGNDQFKEGIQAQHLEGKKIYSAGMGLYGTKEGIDDFYKQYEEPERRIREECNPQEVYFYEYNNHESMYDWDGDENAIRVIIGYWGVDVAKKIQRYSVCKTVDEIANDKR